jgi:hypothetical protein
VHRLRRRSCGEASLCYCRELNEFSNNQWYNDGVFARGIECVKLPMLSCSFCSQTFDNPNNLEMHMQVHLPRNVGYPICGEQSGDNAVQNVESGYCTGCLGVDNARNQIYEFASSKPQMQHCLHDVPMLTNGGMTKYVPEFPYHDQAAPRYSAN